MALLIVQISVPEPEKLHETTFEQISPVSQAPVGVVNGPQHTKSISVYGFSVMVITILPEFPICI